MTQSNVQIGKILFSAIMNGELDKTRLLLKENEFLRLQQHEDNSYFHICLRNHARELVKIFLAEDPSLAAKIGYTKAHQFVEEGNLASLKNIIKTQPELLQATDSYGNTPLHLAATQGNVEIIQYLHQMGAKLSILNSDKNSPLQLALLFDKTTEKNAVKYIINETYGDQHFKVNALSSQHIDLKLINQDAWDLLLHNHENGLIQIGELLKINGYFPLLQDLNIGSQHILNNIDFSGVNFNRCAFNGTFLNVKFAEGTIANSEFDCAYFNHAEFSSFSNFINSSFTDTCFQNSAFNQNQFHNTIISHTSFDNTVLTEAYFDNVFVFNSDLLGLTLSEPQMIQVILNNTIFNPETVQAFANTPHLINADAPVIGLISSHSEIIEQGEIGMTAAAPYARLKQYGTTPVLLDMKNLEKKLDCAELSQEIELILASAPKGVNIPQYVLSQQSENLDKIKAAAQDYAQYLDAAWIPGGPDIHPAFYGQENSTSKAPSSYFREVFEFALIDQMVTHNKPLMGICHGLQIANVYFGGTLIQHVGGHYKHHLVIPIDNDLAGVVSEVFFESSYGVSRHHQAIDTLGEGLQVVAVSGPVIENFITNLYQPIDKTIEVLEGTEGKPVMLFQFHPEYNSDEINRDILVQFVNLAKQSHQANLISDQNSLKLHDILALNQENLEIIEIVPAAPVAIYIPELAQPLLIYSDTVELV